MIARLGLLVSRTIGRFIPDPFILALGLTVFTAVMALLFGFGEGYPKPDRPLTRSEAAETLLQGWWSTGLWVLLGFAMQMALILVTGFALAESRPIRALINKIAQCPRDSASAAALVGLVAMTAGLLNWGWGSLSERFLLSPVLAALNAALSVRTTHSFALRDTPASSSGMVASPAQHLS